jgi:DNA-binding IclR family transcriptional regulator
MRKEKSDYIIQSVDHALKVLEEFHDNVDEVRITELSKRLNLHKNKIFRLLATLTSRNYIEQNKHNEGYRLGLKTLDLGLAFINQLGFLGTARPVQESLAKKCNETTYLSIMKGSKVVYLNAVESNLPVRVVPRIGSRLPFYCSEAGKVFAANLRRDDVLREFFLSEGVKKYTPNTISDPEELAVHLRRAAETGYAIDDEEFEIGVKSVGVPFRDYTKKIVGAVSISGPSFRMSTSRVNNELVPLVKEAARDISSRLGYFY